MKWINEYKYSLFGSRATAFVDILDYRSTSFLSRSPWRETFEKFDNIRETDLSLSTRGIFRNSRQRRGGKRAKKKGGGTACPEENSKVLVTRVRRNGCRVAKLVPRITSCKSPFRAGTDRWLTRNFRVPYTHPPPRNFIRSAFPARPVVPNPRILTFHEYYTNKGSLRHTIFIQIRRFSFELRHLLEEWQLYDNFSFKFL